jgi:membrane fusion protein (multidrug efflux system)
MTRILTLTALLFTAAAHAEPVKGIIEPFKTVTVSSPVIQEVITDILVEEGSVVKEGDVVVQLRNDREKLDVKISEKEIELRTFIARGQERLFKEQMGSEEKALEARTGLELARIQLEAKKLALEEKTIRSPLNGIVVEKHKERGEAVDRVEKLVKIINIDQVYARLLLPPAQRETLKEGQLVKVRVADTDGGDFTGKITLIDPRNDASSGLVRVKVLIENRGHRIKAGMDCFAEFGK